MESDLAPNSVAMDETNKLTTQKPKFIKKKFLTTRSKKS